MSDLFQPLQLNDNELLFLHTLVSILRSCNIDPAFIEVNRLSDKTLNVRLTGVQIGRIKLYGRIIKLQVIEDAEIHWYQGISLEDCMAKLPAWVAYSQSVYRPDRPYAGYGSPLLPLLARTDSM